MQRLPVIVPVVCLACGLTVAGADTAAAKPAVKVRTEHYRVDGRDAAAIVSSMMRQHRLLGGKGRVGRTKMTRKVDWEFSTTGGRCRVKRQSTRLDFVTQLPRHSAEKRLSKRLRKHWRAFAKRVRWHERQHRKIWYACARRAERQVAKASSKSCSGLVRRLERIYDKVSKACDRQHAAFDRSETRKLSRHPLIRASLRR